MFTANIDIVTGERRQIVSDPTSPSVAVAAVVVLPVVVDADVVFSRVCDGAIDSLSLGPEDGAKQRPCHPPHEANARQTTDTDKFCRAVSFISCLRCQLLARQPVG
jgi:hypothetical protein